MASIRLDWAIDRDGYRLETPKPTPRNRRGAHLIGNSTEPRIVRNGGPLIPTTPLEIPGLYRRLADTPPTPESVLNFVRTFGFLTERADAKDESVLLFTDAAKGVRRLVEIADRKDWATIAEWLHGAGQDSMFRSGGIGRLGLIYDYQPNADRPTIHFRLGGLLSAIYVQALMDFADGVNLKKCERPGCGEWFAYGPGTKHRETAIYCSPKCQKADYYQANKGAGK